MTNFPNLRTETGETLGELKNVPHNVSFLGKLPGDSLSKSVISLKWHASSHHLSITNYQSEEYYEDYFMTTTYSESMQNLQKSQIDNFVKLSRGKNSEGAFIEIGCGDGSFLNHARPKFQRVVGIEPSSKFAAAARAQGHTILEGYVQESTPLTSDKFDFFASRQVFEHLPDPLDCLLGVKAMLNPGAIGLIEVPNGYKAFSEGRYFEFFPDHVNYYSVNSLVALATDAGFNVLACTPAFGNDYLELWLSLDYHPSSYLNSMIKQQSETINAVRNWGHENLSKSKNAIFGCGAKTLTMVAQDPKVFEATFQFAIDSDPNKIGRYIPDTTIEVVSLDDPRLHSIENVWIMALSYVSEISKLVSEKMPNTKQVLTLNSNLEVVGLK